MDYRNQISTPQLGVTTSPLSSGFPWTIQLTAQLVNEVKQIFDLDLMARSVAPFEQLAGDLVLLIDVLYVLCREQATERGMTSEQFGESLTPDSLVPAADALCRAIAEFRPAWRGTQARRFLHANKPLFQNQKGQ